MIPPERRIIVVDGVTNAGKSTAVKILRNMMPGCTQVKFSDYYHKGVQRAVQKVGVDISTLSGSDIRGVITHNQKRYLNLLDMVQQSPFDDYLIERLHPTDYVYQQLFFDRKGNFAEIEDRLNELGAEIVLLTLNDEALRYRMEDTLGQRNRRSGASFEVPADILSFDSNRRKRDLYLEWYEQSGVERKRAVDTSGLDAKKLEKLVTSFIF